MPQVWELHQSREFTIDARTTTVALEYMVTGTMNESEAFELVRNASPTFFFYLVRKSIKAAPQGGGIWFMTVDYDASLDPQQEAVSGGEPGSEPPEPPPTAPGPDEPLGPSFTFDTTGGTAHITQSRETVSMTLSTGLAAANNKRAIGLTKDEVKGCEIYVPQNVWTKEVQRRNCTQRYIQTIVDLTGTVNYDRSFFGYPKGSVLYLGASGKFTARERWTITHKFAMQKREVNLVVSDDITVAEKLGWDYLWVGYEPAQAGNKLLQKPTAAYVERVYKSGDFALLEIGV